MNSVEHNRTRTGVYKPFHLADLTCINYALCTYVGKENDKISKFKPPYNTSKNDSKLLNYVILVLSDLEFIFGINV